MKITSVIVLGGCVILLVVGFFIQARTNPEGPPKLAAKLDSTLLHRVSYPVLRSVVEKKQEGAIRGWAQREDQRNLLMGWTIAILVAVIGFAYAKHNNNAQKTQKVQRSHLFVVALVACLFMHALDTMHHDLTNRQLAYSSNFDFYIMRWDSLSQDEKITVVTKVNEGNEPDSTFLGKTGQCRKTELFFFGGVFMSIWWWGLSSIIAFLWANEENGWFPIRSH